GRRADARTILRIPTMRYALVGVSALLFTINAIGAALPQFYERDLGVEKGAAEALVGVLVVAGGIPGVMLGGRFADRFMNRVRGRAWRSPPTACSPGVPCSSSRICGCRSAWPSLSSWRASSSRA